MARHRYAASWPRRTVPVVGRARGPVDLLRGARPRAATCAAARAARAHAARRRSATGACAAGRAAALEPRRSPRASASRAASSPRPTGSSPPRATWRRGRARRCGSRAPCARRRRAPPAPLAAAAASPYDFRPGLPDLAGFPRDRWLRSLRARLARDARSTPSATPTRAACPSCATRSPTTSAACAAPRPTPSTCSSAPGFRQGFSLTCRWLREHGDRAGRARGSRLARAAADRRAGRAARSLPIPVDADGHQRRGARGERRRRRRRHARAPVPDRRGAEPERRAALIAWAERGDRLIIEDDYDAELLPRRGSARCRASRPSASLLHRLGEQAADAGHAAGLDAARRRGSRGR